MVSRVKPARLQQAFALLRIYATHPSTCTASGAQVATSQRSGFGDLRFFAMQVVEIPNYAFTALGVWSF